MFHAQADVDLRHLVVAIAVLALCLPLYADDLAKKRQELVKPIQDAIYKAVKELSAEGSYAIIFDTASGASILYSNPRYDLSDEVLKKLGYKN